MVLATNQLQFVAMADQVLFMRDGQVQEAGTYQSLLAAGGEFTSFMKEIQVEDESAPSEGSSSGSGEGAEVTQGDSGEGGPSGKETAGVGAGGGSSRAAALATAAGAAAAAGPAQGPPGGPPGAAAAAKGRLVEEEASATGGVSGAVVAAYLRALGGPLAVVVLGLTFVGQELLRVAATVWLSVWTGEWGGWMGGSVSG